MKKIVLVVLLTIFTIDGISKENLNNLNKVCSKNNLLSENEVIKKKLLKCYSEFIDSISNDYVYFKNKSRIEFYNKLNKKNFEDSLNNASIKDQFCQKYVVGKNYTLPISVNNDAGRIRNDEFFKKIYGKNKIEVENNLTTVVWLPNKLNKKIIFSKINGASSQLQKVSQELDKLPDSLIKYCNKLGGTFSWRPIAGTNRLSMHSFAIAIDINTEFSHYWRNNSPDKNGIYIYRNNIPFEIVSIFEKHGFIWGGKWYHFDTMHFEYRPELILNL